MKKIGLCLLMVCNLLGIEKPTFDDYYACYEKVKSSELTYEGMPAYVLAENLLAVVKIANSKLNKYVKYDPFLNLYLVRTDFSLIVPEFANETEKTRFDWLGIIDSKKEYIGHIKYLAQDIEERDKLDFKSKIGLLTSPCCKMLGVALNNNEFIGNRYLNHFKKYNEVYWGDIGVEFTQKGDRYFVNKIYNNAKFRLNDEIISVNDKSVNSLRELNEEVLFSPNQSTIYFRVLRDNEEVDLSVLVQPKIFSSISNTDSKIVKVYKKETIVTRDIIVDKNMKIISIKKDIKNLKIGDKILRFNNKILTNSSEFYKLYNENIEATLLISRYIKDLDKEGNFQFFVKLKK